MRGKTGTREMERSISRQQDISPCPRLHFVGLPDTSDMWRPTMLYVVLYFNVVCTQSYEYDEGKTLDGWIYPHPVLATSASDGAM